MAKRNPLDKQFVPNDPQGPSKSCESLPHMVANLRSLPRVLATREWKPAKLAGFHDDQVSWRITLHKN